MLKEDININDVISGKYLIIILSFLNILLSNIGIFLSFKKSFYNFSNWFSLVCVVFSAFIVILMAIGLPGFTKKMNFKHMFFHSPLWSKILLIIIVFESLLISNKISFIKIPSIPNEYLNAYVVSIVLNSIFLVDFLAKCNTFIKNDINQNGPSMG